MTVEFWVDLSQVYGLNSEFCIFELNKHTSTGLRVQPYFVKSINMTQPTGQNHIFTIPRATVLIQGQQTKIETPNGPKPQVQRDSQFLKELRDWK